MKTRQIKHFLYLAAGPTDRQMFLRFFRYVEREQKHAKSIRKRASFIMPVRVAPHSIVLRKSSGKAAIMDGSGDMLGTGMHFYLTRTLPFARGDILLLYLAGNEVTCIAAYSHWE